MQQLFLLANFTWSWSNLHVHAAALKFLNVAKTPWKLLLRYYRSSWVNHHCNDGMNRRHQSWEPALVNFMATFWSAVIYTITPFISMWHGRLHKTKLIWKCWWVFHFFLWLFAYGRLHEKCIEDSLVWGSPQLAMWLAVIDSIMHNGIANWIQINSWTVTVTWFGKGYTIINTIATY